MENKVVLITGATGALGSAAANVFDKASANLALTGREQAKLQEISTQLSKNHFINSCDLSSETECENLISKVIDYYGSIDILLNVAGGFAMGPKVHELRPDDFTHMFNTNFISTFNTCKSVIPQMIQQGAGRIINVSARAATEGKAKMAPYCISKSAVVTLTESLAAEHKQDDINVNCILPGTIDTQTNRKDMPNADYSTWVPTMDLANTMLFLSSNLANSINGALIPVYGKS
ncbi:MAG: SDR family NAD(P)-dependent oxidoreductase [Pseudomonadota bacterium]